MQIHSFTKPELDYLRENCNFVNNEVQVFEMRSRGIPLEAIAEALNIPLRTLQRELSSLKKSDKISFLGAPKNGGYFAK